MISAFELFKIGIGPSSSHTVGPMKAAALFRRLLTPEVDRVSVDLFGSLAWTGKGHGSDQAICLGLLGCSPETVDPEAVPLLVSELRSAKQFPLGDGGTVAFDPETDIGFDFETLLPMHSNGMRFRAVDALGGVMTEKAYYSVGGGFVVDPDDPGVGTLAPVPFTFVSSAELLALCRTTKLSIGNLQMANEAALTSRNNVEAGLDGIVEAMLACIARGLSTDGLLPGKLRVKRRAKGLMLKLEASRGSNVPRPHEVMDWVSAFAIAVNEENAAGGRVVTAPTNGAAGILPAVLRYFRDFCPEYSLDAARSFLLTAAAIGSLFKRNASISGAEVGCQGEVGSAASMAAAGLAAVLGGTPEQVENAAEIAMEHHLGMTCDPIGGLVQIPCIERNAFGANKAILAASLALNGNGDHYVSLDAVIETMRQTGADMQSKYKETSRGGLAVNVAEC